MIRRLAIACCLVLGIGLSATNAQVQQTFEYGGVERTYYLDLPADLATGAPLVFVLHGYGGSAWGTYAITPAGRPSQPMKASRYATRKAPTMAGDLPTGTPTSASAPPTTTVFWWHSRSTCNRPTA